MSTADIDRMLRRVSFRGWTARAGGTGYRAVLVLSAIYGVLFILSRLLALLPDWFGPEMVAIVPAAAMLAAVLWARRPARESVSRLVDTAAGTKDLFLTYTLLDKCGGEYGPLVSRQAEEKAVEIRPSKVVAFEFRRKVGLAALALSALLLAAIFVPQSDPFGLHAERDELARKKKELADARSAMQIRIEALKKKREAAAVTKADLAIESLEQVFRTAKPEDREGNLKQLIEHQKALGQMWDQKRRESLARALKREDTAQRFGQADSKKLSQWKEELKKGETEAIRKELGEMGRLLKKLQETTDPAEQEKLREELRKRLQEMKEFAKSNLDMADLDQALSQAMEQLSMCNCKGLSAESMAALGESLSLLEQQFGDMADAMRQLQSLEDALDALRMAKALNSTGKLDGAQEGCRNCGGMADYAAYYRTLLGQCGLGAGNGTGPGMGGAGTGQGGLAPEDEGQETAFTPEKSRSELRPGKMLMDWKVKGISNKGQVNEEYLATVREVQQNASEAIVHEEVPPGYHDTIRKYFGTINEGDGKNDE
ncbi:MAG: hypothetical protein JW909_04060 [Planctomycetes bacterium]|nr:hypothetical protein [Planctomycetota bacterium]